MLAKPPAAASSVCAHVSMASPKVTAGIMVLRHELWAVGLDWGYARSHPLSSYLQRGEQHYVTVLGPTKRMERKKCTHAHCTR